MGTTSFLCYNSAEHHKIFTHSLPPFKFNISSQDMAQQAPAQSLSTEMALGCQVPAYRRICLFQVGDQHPVQMAMPFFLKHFCFLLGILFPPAISFQL